MQKANNEHKCIPRVEAEVKKHITYVAGELTKAIDHEYEVLLTFQGMVMKWFAFVVWYILMETFDKNMIVGL